MRGKQQSSSQYSSMYTSSAFSRSLVRQRDSLEATLPRRPQLKKEENVNKNKREFKNEYSYYIIKRLPRPLTLCLNNRITI